MCTTCPCLLREHEPREHLEMEVAARRPADLPHAARLLVARHLPLEAQQRRLDEIVTSLLPSLNPTADPSRSELFSGTWECTWTNEKELSRNGLRL